MRHRVLPFATDAAGHGLSSGVSTSIDPIRGHYTATFERPLSEIRSFGLELQTYDKWAEFRDVSLKPGVASRVTVVTSEDPVIP